MMAEPAEQTEIPFYDAVSDLAKTVEAAVYDIRIDLKPAGFHFSDLKGIGKYKDDFGLVEQVAEAYLSQTGADAYVFRASRNPNDFRRGTAISENTSIIEGHVKAWKEYYGTKATTDFMLKNMKLDTNAEAHSALGMDAHQEGIAALAETQRLADIANKLGNGFTGVINRYTRDVYDAFGIKENPELLYALAFNAEAEKRGWHTKKGDELAGTLRRKGISISDFEHYTNRDLALEQEEKTRAAQPAPAPIPAAQTVQAQRPARPRPAQTGINPDDIGAAVDAAERGETVRQTTPTEPRIYTEPYVLRNIRCVGSDGNVFEQYAELRVQADVVRQQGNNHRSFTPYQAIVHFERQGEEFLPSEALSCNVLIALFRAAVRKEADGTYTTLDEHAKQILDQYKDHGRGYGWHAQNTVVNWQNPGLRRRAKSEIIHYPTKDDFTKHGGEQEINTQRPKITKEFNRKGFESCTLEQACQKPNQFAFLQDFTGLQNPRELGEVAEYYGRTPRVWISSENKTLAAWLGCADIGGFVLSASGYLGGAVAARGVAS